MKKTIVISVILLSLFGCTSSTKENEQVDSKKILSVKEYQDAVYASWIGQIVGNTYGLCYEFNFIENPGPDSFPYRYTWTLDSLKKYDGAFSDDDTDIEFMYLTQMEKNGIEPTYFNLAEAWKKHVKTKVWCANRAAVGLMKAGHYPPITGSVQFNPQWCQIDPQLVNEIWAVTAPGMIRYAVDKSTFSAKITNDSFGVEPTIHYAAMYSAAFFEKDIPTLIDIGNNALPANARFKSIVEEVKALYKKYPEDWKAARKIIKEKYYVYEEYNKYAWPVIDANLNGALGIMALLYGKGDFRKTLDYCCAFGMDADNQAATMCGLLGIVYGIDKIPHDLLYPVTSSNWKEPFNNSYRMVTREGLESTTLKDIANRMCAQGEKIILARGGKKFTKDGSEFYEINSDASFQAPFELNPLPQFSMEVNKSFSYPVYTGRNASEITIKLLGEVPDGISLNNGVLQGSPTKSGTFQFTLEATEKETKKSIPVSMVIHAKNLAPSASTVICNPSSINKNIELIRDGKTNQSYYSIKKGEAREIDYYGYTWDNEQTIGSLSFNNGKPEEYCGWFTSFQVEYLKNNQWIPIKDIKVFPEMSLENTQWLKPSFIDYEISFAPIKTKGIRIIGLSGGIQKDPANAYLGLQYYSSISELRAYSD